MTDEEREALEHRDAKLNILAVLATKTGKDFIKYLFKSLDVGELPELGLEGSLLMDRIGFLRCGNSIFKLVSEADPMAAGTLLAEIEKERHERLYNESKNDSGV